MKTKRPRGNGAGSFQGATITGSYWNYYGYLFYKGKDAGPAIKENDKKTIKGTAKEADGERISWEGFRQDDGEAGESETGLGHRLAELSQQLEKLNLAEYMNYLNNPRRYLVVNFMGGLFRGLGVALGATILGAFLLYVLQKLVVLNLPVIGDFLADLIRIILTHL